jgi:hypothetical protein
MNRNAFLKISFVFLIFAFSVESSLACMYGPPYRTVCENYAQADSVIVGKIESVKPGDSAQTVIIKIEKTFKGETLKQIVLNQPQSTCDPNFSDDVGETLLLYVIRDKKTKKYSVIAPGTGGRVKRESEDLYWLKNLPMSLNRTRFSGTVELYKDDPFEFINYIVGTKVRVFNDKNSFEALTDKNGVYEIWDIPIGKYEVKPMLTPSLEVDLTLEKGLVDFRPFDKNKPDYGDTLIEIKAKGCGGIDFVVNEKTVK